MWTVLATLWGGFGANGWSADGKKCEFAVRRWRRDGRSPAQRIFTDKALPGPGTTADFFARRLGLTVTQISRASLLRVQAVRLGHRWPLPAGPAGNAQVSARPGIGVLAKEKHAQQAADFLAFFSDKANSAKLAQYSPVRRASLINGRRPGQGQPAVTPEQLQQVVVDGIKNGTVSPAHQQRPSCRRSSSRRWIHCGRRRERRLRARRRVQGDRSGARPMRRNDALIGWLFIAPQVLGFAAFVLLAAHLGVLETASTAPNLLSGISTFTGAANYQQLVTDPVSPTVARVTFFFCIGLVVLNLAWRCCSRCC